MMRAHRPRNASAGDGYLNRNNQSPPVARWQLFVTVEASSAVKTQNLR